jgi:general secretion pathway protein A
MDFHAHFGLRKTPFTREIDVEEMFVHPQHDEIKRCIVRAVQQRMSAALQAPAGFGKTALVRAVREELSDVRYHVHYVKVTGLSKRDMCREIAKSLGLPEVGTYPRLVHVVQEAVETRSMTDGVRTVLVLDDAHELRPDVLSMFKALTNFEMDSRLLLSVVLVGQPRLSMLLRRVDLDDVAQRLSWFGELRALSRDETQAYVVHRCHIAGATRELFDPRALEALYEMGRGNPRATDHLARRSLEVAHDGDIPVVSAQHVIAARATLRL